PESRLYYSGVAILFFATTVFILSLRFNMNMIKKVNQQLDTHKNFLQTVIDHNPNFIYAVNQEGVFTLVNKSFAELYGSNPQALIGKTINTIQPNQSLINNEDIYEDRKSTRLNSSHVKISYAVFCLKKKNHYT